jgi:hypothetical protein
MVTDDRLAETLVKAPERRAALGADAAVSSLQNSLGVNLGIVHVYAPLGTSINTPSNLHFIAEHKTLLISLAGGDTIKTREGRLEQAIVTAAQQVAALKVPVLFEYRWEMDRPNLQSTMHSGADYIAAWDRVRSVFTAQHVTNAEFVWCPQHQGFASGVAPSSYPGDNEVDWVCADVYSPPTGSVKLRQHGPPVPDLGQGPPDQTDHVWRVRGK